MAPGSCTLNCKQLNMCTQSHRVYSQTLGQAKCVHKSRRDHRNLLSFDQIKNCQKRRCPYFQILMGPFFLEICITSWIEHFRHCPWTEDTYLFNLKCFYSSPLAHNRSMIYRGNIQDVLMNQVCLFICVRGSIHPISQKQYLSFLFVCCFVLRSGLLPLNTNWLCRAVIFARCVNLAFGTLANEFTGKM